MLLSFYYHSFIAIFSFCALLGLMETQLLFVCCLTNVNKKAILLPSVLLQRQPSPDTLETLLKENSELTERVTSLSQEKASLKHTLASLERQLRRTESELAKVSTDSENRPISDLTSNSKVSRRLARATGRPFYHLRNCKTCLRSRFGLQVQRLYERYLRAESFRKALVYQKRYLLLLLGGFQECEQATLCLIATMGVHTSPPLSSQRTPLGRFRAAVRVAIAVSR